MSEPGPGRRRRGIRRPAATPEGSQARVVRNTLANAGGSVITVAATLILTPFMIHELGTDAYGVWVLATTLTFGLGYLSFADFGFEQAAVRFVAEARAEGDVEEVNRLWVTAFAALGAIALVLTPILILLAGPLVELFAVPEDLESEARIAFTFVIAQLLLELPGRGFAALLEGSQRFGLWQLARVFQSVVLSLLMVAVLLDDRGIDWLGIATFAGQTATFALLAAFAFFGVPEARFSPRYVSKRAARKLVSFGSQLLIFRILSAIVRPMDAAIIGIFLTASAVTVYEVGNKLFLGAMLIQTLATSALVPATAFSRDHSQRLRELLLRGSNYTVAIALPIMVALFVFADPIIRTWIGEAQTDSVTPARLLLLTLVPGFAISVGQTMLVALGIVRLMILMVAGYAALNLGLSLALVGPMGVEGVIVATLISTVALFFPVTWLFLREIGVGALEWARDVLLPVVPAFAVQVGVGLLLLPIADGTDSLVLVAALGAISIVAAIGSWVLLGLSKRRRRELFQMLRETAGTAPSEPMAEPPRG